MKYQSNHETLHAINEGHKGNPQILKEILLTFPNLTSLELDDNGIESIEQLNRIYAPSLISLYLANNKVVFAKELRKVNFPSLNLLRLYANKIKEFTSLFQLQLIKVKYISIEYNSNHHQQCSDARWVMKMNLRNFESIFVQSGKRIEQQLMVDCFFRKWRNTQYIKTIKKRL